MENLTEFESAYIEALLWSSVDDNEVPLDSNYSVFDIHADSLATIRRECSEFQVDVGSLLICAGDDAQNGHDFWLTRNGHGVGFWDRGYSKLLGNALTEACKAIGGQDPYVGDDGKIHV